MAPLLGDEVRVSHHPHHRRLVLAREEALPGKHVVELRDRRRAVRLRGRDDDDEEGDDEPDLGLYDTDDYYDYYDYPAENAMGMSRNFASSYVAIKPAESEVEDTIERGAQLPPRSTPSDLR